MSKFALATTSKNITAAGRNAITAYFEGEGWHVWHWFEDLWLVDSGDEEISKNYLLKILRAVPILQKSGSSMLILSLDPGIAPVGFVEEHAVPWIIRRFQDLKTTKNYEDIPDE